MRLRSCLFALTTALALHARIDASPLIFTDRATSEAFGNRTYVFRSIRLRPPPMGSLYTCRNNPHFSRWHAGGLVAVHCFRLIALPLSCNAFDGGGHEGPEIRDAASMGSTCR